MVIQIPLATQTRFRSESGGARHPLGILNGETGSVAPMNPRSASLDETPGNTNGTLDRNSKYNSESDSRFASISKGSRKFSDASHKWLFSALRSRSVSSPPHFGSVKSLKGSSKYDFQKRGNNNNNNNSTNFSNDKKLINREVEISFNNLKISSGNNKYKNKSGSRRGSYYGSWKEGKAYNGRKSSTNFIHYNVHNTQKRQQEKNKTETVGTKSIVIERAQLNKPKDDNISKMHSQAEYKATVSTLGEDEKKGIDSIEGYTSRSWRNQPLAALNRPSNNNGDSMALIKPSG